MDGELDQKSTCPLIHGRRSFGELAGTGVDWLRLVVSLKGFWVLLPVLFGVAVVCVGQASGSETQYWKGWNENAAIVIMGATVAVFLVRVVLFRTKCDLVLLMVAVAFLCREIHFEGTTKGVYVAVGIAGAFAWVWRDDILDTLEGRMTFKRVLAGMIWSYFVSIVIQRRFFKHMPFGMSFHEFEQSTHVALEEVTENVAHTMFLLAGLTAFLRSSAPKVGLAEKVENGSVARQ